MGKPATGKAAECLLWVIRVAYIRRCPRYVWFRPDNGMKSGHSGSAGSPLINLRNRQNEPSFTLVLVQSGSIPKAIEFVVNPPADVPPARSELVETLEVVGALGKR